MFFVACAGYWERAGGERAGSIQLLRAELGVGWVELAEESAGVALQLAVLVGRAHALEVGDGVGGELVYEGADEGGHFVLHVARLVVHGVFLLVVVACQDSGEGAE
jgi:hypothetical protein